MARLIGRILFWLGSVFVICACTITPITGSGGQSSLDNKIVALETRVARIETRLQLTPTVPITSTQEFTATAKVKGLALLGQNAANRETITTFPVDQNLILPPLGDATVQTLTKILTGTLHLDLALIHSGEVGQNKWYLYYSESITNVTTLLQSKEFEQLSWNIASGKSTYDQLTLGTPFTITSTLPLTLAHGAIWPSDAQGWITYLRPIIGAPQQGALVPTHQPARLLFSREVDGIRTRVLVIFFVKVSGVLGGSPDNWGWLRHYCSTCGRSCPMWCGW